MRVAVAGSSGRVGRHVMDVLAERGHEGVPMSRSTGVDVITGRGLADALAGVDAIVDAATGPTPEEHAATEFFTTAAHNLQQHGAAVGARRIVGVSIIGADKFVGGYGAAKIAHERALLAGPVPARILRASQFHEFVQQLMDWGRDGDVSQVPQMRTQLVAARTVAEALVELAVDPDPAGDGGTTEIAGPQEERLIEMATLVAARTGDPAKVEEVAPFDEDGRLMASGDLLPGPGVTLAGPTFQEWLAPH